MKKIKHYASSIGKNRFLRRCWPIIFLVVFCLLTLSSVLVFHRATFLVNQDNVYQSYSWYQKLSSSLHSGYIPLWDAGTFGGHSFVGEFQTGVFYPVNLVFVWLFGNQSGISQNALNWLAALHFLAASIGMYLLARRLRLSAWPAIAVGMIYSYSGVLATRSASQLNIFLGLTLIPWAVYFAAKYLDMRRLRDSIFCGLVLGLIILSGHIQPYFHGLIIVFTLLASQLLAAQQALKTKILGLLKQIAIIVAVSLVITLPQIVLSNQYMGQAMRWVNYYVGPHEKLSYATFAKNFNLNPHDLANLINPFTYPISDGNNLFIGLVPLVLIILAIVLHGQFSRFELWRKYRLFILTIIYGGLVIMLGYWTFVAAILYKLPFVYQIRELARYGILVHFGLALTVGIVLEYLHQNPIKLSRVTKSWLIVTGIFLLLNSPYLIIIHKAGFKISYALQFALAGAAILAVVAFVNKKATLMIVLTSLVALNMLLNTRWFLPSVNANAIKVSDLADNAIVNNLKDSYGKYRIDIDDNAMAPNIGDIYKIQTLWGYGATVYQPYYNFMLSKDMYSREYDLMGTRYIVSRRSLAGLKSIDHDQSTGLILYERPNYFPKVFFSDQLNMGGGQIEALNQFKIIEYGDMKQIYQITTPQDRQTIFTEINYPGWHAYIDGAKTTIETAQIPGTPPLLMSVHVPAGSHQVELRYLF